MEKSTILKTVGVIATVIGGGLLYFSGSTEGMVMELVGAVFLGAALISGFIKS